MAGIAGSTYGGSMTSDPGLTRRVERLENDTEAIYELLAELKAGQVAHSARFDGIDARFDGVDTRLAGIDTTLAEILRRLPAS